MAIIAALLGVASAAGAQERVLSCRAAQYIWDPSGPPSVYVNRVWSVVSLVNMGATASINIDRVRIFDRNGAKLCDFGPGNPLPVKAFDPPVYFDFTRPLGPFQALNISTTATACIPWATVKSDDIMGTLTVLVNVSRPRGHPPAAIRADSLVFVQEIQTSLLTSRNGSPCEEIDLR